ncbi:mechanosensitive ion channel family protein [archaeon]|nr:mechanosensitive ion channel family protein [archaeon]
MIKEVILNFTENEYLIALIYLLLSFALIRLGAFILEKIILKLTLKTKTNLDDLIIAKSARPLTLIVLLVGLKIAINQLTLSEKISMIFHDLISSFLVLVVAYLIYVIFDLVYARAWKRFATKTKTKSNDALIQLTQGTVKVVLIIATIIYLLSYWGIEIGPLLAGVGIGGIAIAFALQSSLANVFGGISIILDKTIRVGDLVKLSDGTTGTILHIGLRSTRVKTFDNEMIFVPNSKLSNENVQNIAMPEPKSRVVIPFSVAYGSKIEEVKKIVMKEIKTVQGFANDPEPSVRFLEMADSALNFKAYFFVNSYEERFAAIDEANTKIYNALNKAKISIPFPQMDVHLKK